MRRRALLTAAATAATTLAAGVPGAADDVGDPTAVVESYYQQAARATGEDALADTVEQLAHSASPLPVLAGSTPSALGEARAQTLVDSEVVATNVGTDRIAGTSDFFTEWPGQAAIETIAQHNAVVAVTLEDDRVEGGTVEKEWLVAPENGDWRLVWFDRRDSPQTVVRQYYRSATDVDRPKEFAADVTTLAHSASPLPELVDDVPSAFAGLRQYELETTELVAENVDTDDILNRSDFLAASLTEDEVAAIARENAIVEATLEGTTRESGRDSQEWLVATDEGAWRLVWL